MEQLNRIELKGCIGNVSVKPVGNSEVARFSVATNYSFNDRGGSLVVETTWHSVTAWRNEGKNSRIVEFSELQKGKNVHVVGRIRTQKYTDSEGIERTFYEVLASEVSIIS